MPRFRHHSCTAESCKAGSAPLTGEVKRSIANRERRSQGTTVMLAVDCAQMQVATRPRLSYPCGLSPTNSCLLYQVLALSASTPVLINWPQTLPQSLARESTTSSSSDVGFTVFSSASMLPQFRVTSSAASTRLEGFQAGHRLTICGKGLRNCKSLV